MKSTRIASAALFASLLLLGACEQQPYYGAPPPVAPGIPLPDSANFVADETRYAAGSPVTLRLTNTTPRPLSYNLCRSTVERDRDNNDWIPVQPVAAGCPPGLRTLAPGQQTTFIFRIDPSSKAGDYRVRTELLDPSLGTRASVVSRIFRVNREGSD